jgi:hypothetical protein
VLEGERKGDEALRMVDGRTDKRDDVLTRCVPRLLIHLLDLLQAVVQSRTLSLDRHLGAKDGLSLCAWTEGCSDIIQSIHDTFGNLFVVERVPVGVASGPARLDGDEVVLNVGQGRRRAFRRRKRLVENLVHLQKDSRVRGVV